MADWARVDASNPCPICERPSWCTISEDGAVVRCMRVDSERESQGVDGSIGWIHSMEDPKPISPERIERQADRKSVAEVTEIAKKAYGSPRAAMVREMLAEELGVSVESLERLRVGAWVDHDGTEFSSWPCRNHSGSIVGIVRRYGDGSKKTMRNTGTGLFYATERSDLSGPILIVEGGSDVAAAISAGLKAIGRPSNTGGIGWIKKMVGGSKVIVIGENDEAPEKRGSIPSCKPDCTGCGHCFPGLFGARKTAARLGCEYVLPPEGTKDFREAYQKGLLWPSLIRAL